MANRLKRKDLQMKHRKMKHINGKQWIIRLLIISCFTFVGCGSKSEDNTNSTSIQADYQLLAEENIALQKQLQSLKEEYSYYESRIIMNTQSGFDLKTEILNSLQFEFDDNGNYIANKTDETEKQTSEETVEGQDEITEYADESTMDEEVSIPELSDIEAESRITELKEENEELNREIQEMRERLIPYLEQYFQER